MQTYIELFQKFSFSNNLKTFSTWTILSPCLLMILLHLEDQFFSTQKSGIQLPQSQLWGSLKYPFQFLVLPRKRLYLQDGFRVLKYAFQLLPCPQVILLPLKC